MISFDSKSRCDHYVVFGHFLKDLQRNIFCHTYAVAAAKLALRDGDVPEDLGESAHRVGVMVGTAFGGMETFERETIKLYKKPERPKVCISSLNLVGLVLV